MPTLLDGGGGGGCCCGCGDNDFCVVLRGCCCCCICKCGVFPRGDNPLIDDVEFISPVPFPFMPSLVVFVIGIDWRIFRVLNLGMTHNSMNVIGNDILYVNKYGFNLFYVLVHLCRRMCKGTILSSRTRAVKRQISTHACFVSGIVMYDTPARNGSGFRTGPGTIDTI